MGECEGLASGSSQCSLVTGGANKTVCQCRDSVGCCAAVVQAGGQGDGYEQRTVPGHAELTPVLNCNLAKPKAPGGTFCSTGTVKSSGCGSYTGTCTVNVSATAYELPVTSDGCMVSVGGNGIEHNHGCVAAGDNKLVHNPFAASLSVIEFPSATTCEVTIDTQKFTGTMVWTGGS